MREVVKEILRSHTVPRLAAEAERPLWQHFVTETVAFERKLAEVCCESFGVGTKHHDVYELLCRANITRKQGVVTVLPEELHSH